MSCETILCCIKHVRSRPNFHSVETFILPNFDAIKHYCIQTWYNFSNHNNHSHSSSTQMAVLGGFFIVLFNPPDRTSYSTFWTSSFYSLGSSGYFSRTRFKCSFMVVKPPLYCTGKWSWIWPARQQWASSSFLATVQLVRPPSRNKRFLKEHLVHVRGVTWESFVFREGDLTSRTVARKLQLAHCWRAGHLAASFPSIIQWGVYNCVKLHLIRVLEK